MSRVAGSGVTGDLLAHNIDTALWLNGPIAEVTAMTETFIKERKHNLTGKVEPVGIDDASAFLCRFRERIAGDVRGDAIRARAQGALHARDQRRARVGAHGIFTTCTGCSSSIIATRAALRGWRSIHITDGDHPYMKHWWVPGLQIGYEHTFIHQVADFLEAAGAGTTVGPTFRDGLGDRSRDRCRAPVGADRPVGKSRAGARQQRRVTRTLTQRRKERAESFFLKKKKASASLRLCVEDSY